MNVVIADADYFGIEGRGKAFGRLESAAREGLYRALLEMILMPSSLVKMLTMTCKVAPREALPVV